MAIKVADAFVALCLDRTQLDRDMQQVRADLENMGKNIPCIQICVDTGHIQAQIAQAAQGAAQAAQGAIQVQAAPAVQVQQQATQAQTTAIVGQNRYNSRSSFVGATPAITEQSLGLLPINAAGFSTLPESIRRATDPGSPMGGGWSLGEDVGATLRLLGVRAGQQEGGVAVGAGAKSLGDSLMQGAAQGVNEGKGGFFAAVRTAVDEAIEAGKEAGEISSPSRRSAREIGSPIMTGVAMGIAGGTAAVAGAMLNSIGFAFNSWKAATFGGTFVGPGLNVVQNPGGMLGGGLGGWLGGLGGAMDWENQIGGTPQSLPMASRMLFGQLPAGVRGFGQDLLSGALGSFLPGWAAGPASDMLGTMFGLKAILQPEAITAPGMSADGGGFKDYPYGGGTIFNVQNYFGNGNFTDVEKQVQLGILQSARRLGVY